MKISITAPAILSLIVPVILADNIPALNYRAPTVNDVKERIAAPANSTLFDVWYAKGNRIYQCNPELTGFLHWYNVQTHAFLYQAQGQSTPFDRPDNLVGQLAAAPLSPDAQEANPVDTVPVIYSYRDGSWVGTSRPIATTTKEEGRAERGDSQNLDDHLTSSRYSSTNGYLSHAKYLVRIGSLDGVVPAPEECTTKGRLINKPFTAYFMFYADEDGVEQLAEEKAEWERMVAEYTPEKLNIEHEAADQRVHAEP